MQLFATVTSLGFLINQLTAPVDCTAPAIPVTVVVSVTGLPKVGLGDAVKVTEPPRVGVLAEVSTTVGVAAATLIAEEATTPTAL